MVAYKTLDKRQISAKATEEMAKLIEGFQEEYLQGIATSVVLDSPVDTGTYMESHNIGTSPEGAFNSSRGKERNRNYQTFAQPTLDRLFAEIEAVSSEDLNKVYIYNTAEHATDVEYIHGYEPYSRAISKAPQIAKEAAAKVRARNK
jgi:hypothetical protein